MFRFLSLAIAIAAVSVAAAWAQAQDSSRVAAALEALGDDDPARALALVAGQDTTTRALVTWSVLRAGYDDFDAYETFLADFPNWPGLARLSARGEEAMPEDLSPARVIAYFDGQPPRTGEGAVRLAAALEALGEGEAADAIAIEAWLELGLTEEGHDAMIGAFRALLTPYHAARADALLWRWRTEDAERLIGLLDAGQAALVRARIALIRESGNETALINAVPNALGGHPGLAYDRFTWRAGNGMTDSAIALLDATSTSAEALGEPFRWSGWRRSLARLEMREGDPARAYRLAANHFLTEGPAFLDLEWLAGYIALRKLNDPDLALTHFRAFEAQAEGPISRARAAYWIGRAEEALGNVTVAEAAFVRAAEFQTSFYGLLAADRLGLTLDPALAGTDVPPDWRQTALASDPRISAGLLLAGAGQEPLASLFMLKVAEDLDATGLAQLGELLSDAGRPYLTVIVGKEAADREIVLPRIYFPLHPVTAMDLPVDPALVLAVARRESEFYDAASSPVGAQGLMQVMPGTARDVSAELGIAYSRSRLVTDWQYNATLGATYLEGLIERFGDSPVLVAAGYNAGPGRPLTWMELFGDPRSDSVDVVDWIEGIPFRETRNYVMRVAESLPVYHARVTGAANGTVRFEALLRGSFPVRRPLARGEGLAPPPAPIRPLAREDS